MKVKFFNKDAIIYFEDTPPKNIYLIKSGKICMEKFEDSFLIDGKLKKNKTLFSGEIFGYEEFFANTDRKSRTTALEKSEIIYFEKDEFINLLSENISLGEKILNSLIDRIKGLNNKLKEITIYKEDDVKEENIIDIYNYFFNVGKIKIANEILDVVEKNDEDNKLSSELKKDRNEQ